MSTKEQKERIELLQGTLDLLILRTLLLGPAHGHAIAKAIEFRSDEVLQVEQGSLYPALHRLIKRRWISVEEGTSENNRRAIHSSSMRSLAQNTRNIRTKPMTPRTWESAIAVPRNPVRIPV
jgi:Transcriptional regulator PadR-like family